MLSSKINFNPSIMTSTVLRTQYVKPRTEEPFETGNVYSKANEEVTKFAKLERILPSNDVNVKYVASAFYSLPPTERPIKSLWA